MLYIVSVEVFKRFSNYMELEINTLLLISNYIHCLFTEFGLRDTDPSLFVEAQLYIFFMFEDIMCIQFFGYNF